VCHVSQLGSCILRRRRRLNARELDALGFVDPIDKVVDPLVYRGSDVTLQFADRDDL
jgi:hypothetical protein